MDCNSKFDLFKTFPCIVAVSLYICKTYSELPTYISITLLILFLPLARSIHSIFLHLLRPYLEMNILSCSFQSPWKNNAFHADLFLLTLLRSFFCTPVCLAFGWNFAFMHVLAWVLQNKNIIIYWDDYFTWIIWHRKHFPATAIIL